ncbi:MAG TPA: TRIC cation channel family protein [Reyranella sp.]|nr:TRIC cation channel family protein [Reyranella sp.]
MLFDIVDLGATFVFAISGATQGVRHRLDLFGVLVVAWAAAVTGGLARDLLIGAVPPVAISDWRYLAAAAAAGLLGFLASGAIARLKTPVQLFDAAGLCLFAVTGTEKALAHGLEPAMAAVLGMITCIGGGVARDLLTLQVPAVLRSEIYAIAALAGSASIALGRWLELPRLPVIAFGAGLCLFLRLMAIYRGWRLPIARFAAKSPEETE